MRGEVMSIAGATGAIQTALPTLGQWLRPTREPPTFIPEEAIACYHTTWHGGADSGGADAGSNTGHAPA